MISRGYEKAATRCYLAKAMKFCAYGAYGHWGWKWADMMRT